MAIAGGNSNSASVGCVFGDGGRSRQVAAAGMIESLFVLVLLLLSQPVTGEPQVSVDSSRQNSAGRTYLPTGVYLDPAGHSFGAGNMPLAMAVSPEGDRLVLSLCGWRQQGLQVIECGTGQVFKQSRRRVRSWESLSQRTAALCTPPAVTRIGFIGIGGAINKQRSLIPSFLPRRNLRKMALAIRPLVNNCGETYHPLTPKCQDRIV
jgi:hypothetical protein